MGTHVYRWQQHDVVQRSIEVKLNVRPLYKLHLLLPHCNSKRGIGFLLVLLSVAVYVRDPPLADE